MTDLSTFDPNGPSNPKNNIFGLPFKEQDARLVIVPVPWEVTASYGSGASRCADHIFQASMQVDLLDDDFPDSWKEGFYMRPVDKKILMKSDYLRKEAELYIDYISKGESLEKNAFMRKSLKDINEGSVLLNTYVYEQTKDLLLRKKLVGLLGGDHSVSLGYLKALAEKQGNYGVLQIDAHCDLRKSYEGFTYSHGSIMRNTLEEIPEVSRLVQLGTRDYCQEELDYVQGSQGRVICYFDKDVRERQYEGQGWSQLADEITRQLPEKVYLSFDIDGLDPKLCPHTGTPVPGGLETGQVFFLVKKIMQSGRKLIGFDLVEVGIGETGWDANVGARILWKLSSLIVASNF